MLRGVARSARISLAFCVTVGFFWLLSTRFALDDLAGAFEPLSASIVALALLFLGAGYAIRIVRWWSMLRILEPRLPFRDCVWPYVTSIAVNNVLPLRAGDALRVFAFRRQLRSPAARIMGTLIIERLLDLLVLLTLFLAVASLRVGAAPETLLRAGAWLAGTTVIGLLVLVLSTPWLHRAVSRVAELDYLARKGWSESVRRHGSHLVDALGLLRPLPQFGRFVGLTALAWLFEGAVFATVAAGLQSGAAALGAWFALAAATLATLIPSSPGYLGTFDYFAAQALAAFGAADEGAVAFALTVHVLLWAPLTAAGLLYFVFRSKRVGGSRLEVGVPKAR
jgi:glycosyltransferase 2 family protein